MFILLQFETRNIEPNISFNLQEYNCFSSAFPIYFLSLNAQMFDKISLVYFFY